MRNSEKIVEYLASQTDHEVKVVKQYSGEDNVYINFDYRSAVAIEYLDGNYQSWVFRWDATGGVAEEAEIAVGKNWLIVCRQSLAWIRKVEANAQDN